MQILKIWCKKLTNTSIFRKTVTYMTPYGIVKREREREKGKGATYYGFGLLLIPERGTNRKQHQFKKWGNYKKGYIEYYLVTSLLATSHKRLNARNANHQLNKFTTWKLSNLLSNDGPIAIFIIKLFIRNIFNYYNRYYEIIFIWRVIFSRLMAGGVTQSVNVSKWGDGGRYER